jgi:two-component system, LytTR family, response regulator AlgR
VITQQLLRILIVDDEPLARARIKRLLLQQAGYVCVAEAENAKQALALTQQHKPDVVLMDIEMPEVDGISLACKLEGLTGLGPIPSVIFVTAHAEHALEAYRAGPLDYILKPVSASRLFDALHRAQTKIAAMAATPPIPVEKLNYTIAGVTKQLLVSDILYCVADDKYVRVLTKDTAALIDKSLTQLQQILPAQFVRTHRKIVINADYFASLHTDNDGRSYIKLQGLDEKLDVSRRALATVKQTLRLVD